MTLACRNDSSKNLEGVNKGIIGEEDEKLKMNSEAEDLQDLKIYKTKNFIFYHVFMCFACIYVGLVFSNWNDLN